MATINSMIRSRRQFWRTVKRQMRAVDSAQERAERRVNRIIARRTKVPTESDLAAFLQELQTVATELANLTENVSRGYAL